MSTIGMTGVATGMTEIDTGMSEVEFATIRYWNDRGCQLE